MSETERIDVDPGRAALIIQDLQNDVMAEGGAFAESGAPQHAKEQNVVENVKQLAEACRSAGIPVIHVHYIVEEGAPGLKLNAPLFQGVKDTNALVRGTWGAAPVDGLEAQEGDFVVEKMRMSAWEGTRLERLLATEMARDARIQVFEASAAVERMAGNEQQYLWYIEQRDRLRR